MSFQNKVRQFMYGRYGIDDLYRFLFGTYIALWLINLFFRNPVISTLSLVVAAFLIYRTFSRNIPKRQAENAKYLELKSKLFRRNYSSRSYGGYTSDNRAYNAGSNSSYRSKTANRDAYHLYKKCKNCNTTLRLPIPSKKGFKTATCPRCGNDVKFFTMKSVKIEVVK